MNLFFLLLWFAVCADQDARCRRVSNAWTLGAGLIVLGYLLINGSSWLGASTPQAGWALLTTLALTLPGYALRRLGAGDVKLLVTLALASDPLHMLGTFVGAGVASTGWLLVRQKVWPHTGQWFRRRYPHLASDASSKQPFVPFLFLGFLATAAGIH
ncbi:prepilin peptidase [Pseudomonas sp. LP_7_YM]|uniref:prepilin peptidase n=1 Tax=Pseudomonas sp. LP_7_YM TaxID=2485137 RepID=UPI00105D0BDD|nr:prepilin peptidase [Pseudomonas sp. LP_7_YM]TDV65832.1 prepilin peptidase CpaA [Pseudomonas sp. LP_7_YM]